MPHTASGHRFIALLFTLALITLTSGAFAQPAPGQPAPARPGAQPQPPAVVVLPMVPADPANDFDAERVREQFYEVLEKYPPSLGRVLKLDPSLMANEAYLAPYPGVALFLAQHPEIGRNPSYFLERINTPGFGAAPDPARAEAARRSRTMLAAFAAFLVFLVVIGVVVWVIRTIIDTRRWNRVSKTQAEVHTKLLDRFASNEDLLAYIQTPVGRVPGVGPAPLPEDARPIGAPFSRILLSVQAGIVLAVAAAGNAVPEPDSWTTKCRRSSS